VYVDTSDLTIEEVVKVLKGIVEERANVSRG
jgi:cytidylate kinase